MSASNKDEFPPLLPPGLHHKSLEEVESLCVKSRRFELSKTRQEIMNGLKTVVDRLEKVGITGELWVNGSFLTEKIDPEDVDIVLCVNSEQCEIASDEQIKVLDWLEGNLKDSLHCDSYLRTEWSENHDHYWLGEYYRAFWMKQFGFSRGEDLKGIAVLVLGKKKNDLVN